MAEVGFLDETLSLIHIPLSVYSQFVQPIIRILLPPSLHNGSTIEDKLEGFTLDQKHGFLNISVTPIECSIVCHDAWSKKFFEPIIKQLPKDAAKTVSMSKQSYLVLRVSSPGMDAGRRVVDLTSPLGLAGIPIFFITTYYSDFIIVPSKDRQAVVQVLLAGGFECPEDSNSSFVSPGALSHTRGLSSEADKPPSSPPPSNVAELQARTFKLLKKHNVVPHIEPDLRLVQCSGKDVSHNEGYSWPARSYSGNGNRREAWVDKVDTKFYTGLIAALASQPKFLSVTLTEEDEPSLLLDKSLLDTFGDSLIGPMEAELVPIFLDLVDLPFDTTGIVAGVAGKLAEELQMEQNAELSYLSTAKTGAVILSSEQAGFALEALSPLLPKDD
ncbi:hypothetical protein VP1G_07983 [Cytospora mali]|uniref:CASTOR ACT domain-containing protein n=1 Tax=Cytospora mali TaxID=578113 RepID=A0A194VA80_CYTMA|nr:hypothetical protein VP1G_07983 [Valsa mali var. pyri (nom. inval.)]